MLQNAISSQWNAGKVLAECLNLLADIDDLQSAVCILIVLGDRRNDIPIDESIHVSEKLKINRKIIYYIQILSFDSFEMIESFSYIFFSISKSFTVVNLSIQEYWLLSYIDLLQRHQFWHEATEIVKLSWLRRVCQVNQQSTSVHINCGECGRLVSNATSCYCNKCKSLQSSKCSVCDRIVKGLYAWCQGCSHGGHLIHMKEWFSMHSKCPRCGHLCEYE